MSDKPWRDGWRYEMTEGFLYKGSSTCANWSDVDKAEARKRGFRSVWAMEHFYGIKERLTR